MGSALAKSRRKYQPALPACFRALETVSMVETELPTASQKDREEIEKSFPRTHALPLIRRSSSTQASNGATALKIGVVLSGGQASGGHNVIAGLFDAIKSYHNESLLIGFLKGPKGIVNNTYLEIDKTVVDEYRNQGGFDMIGSGRDKIEKGSDLEKAKLTCEKNDLDGLVIVGGDDSNTNAAVLAEYFLEAGVRTSVIGVPKTIDGDLQNDYVQISFGFDTATKVYANIISNIQKDAKSSCKYTHFIKLMGRSASHIALECALQTHPHYTLISEAIASKGLTIKAITDKLCDIVETREKQGKPYGVFLIPEGVIEFIPEMGVLIDEINQWFSQHESGTDSALVISELEKTLSKASLSAWNSLPDEIKKELIMDRDPHGNVQVSHIQTEKLLASIMIGELKRREKRGAKKIHFAPVYHFLGYEGRSTFPSNFDANYCYSLGFVAAVLIKSGATGRMCALEGLEKPPLQWEPVGVPITCLMNFEKRKGVMKPVIRKALVELSSKPYMFYKKHAPSWEMEDDDQSVGPVQFEGSHELCETVPMIVQLNSQK